MLKEKTALCETVALPKLFSHLRALEDKDLEEVFVP